MVSGFSGEHSSPLQPCTIDFVGATCGRPLKQCCYPINDAIDYTRTHAVHNHRAGDGERADCCRWQEEGGEQVAAASNPSAACGRYSEGIACAVVGR